MCRVPDTLKDKELEKYSLEYLFKVENLEYSDLGYFQDVDGGPVRMGWFYDEPPDYAKEDLDLPVCCEVRTFIRDCEIIYPPEVIYDPDGSRWDRVFDAVHSGEDECPVALDESGGCYGQSVLVTQDHCNLYSEPGEDPKVCPFCESAIGHPHGYLYMGSGWCELVYVKRPRTWLDEPVEVVGAYSGENYGKHKFPERIAVLDDGRAALLDRRGHVEDDEIFDDFESADSVCSMVLTPDPELFKELLKKREERSLR